MNDHQIDRLAPDDPSTKTTSSATKCEDDHQNMDGAARGAGLMETPPNAAQIKTIPQPKLELSVGLARPWIEHGKIKIDQSGREMMLDLGKVEPWTGTPRQLHILLNSHRYASTNKGFKHKAGHFIVGAVFAGNDKHPTGHRHSSTLQRATLVLLDIDDAPNLTRAELQKRLKTLGSGFIFYSTWSNGRRGVPKPKAGLCARVLLWLSRPLTAPDDQPQTERVALIGQRLAALVGFVASHLELPVNSTVLDKMSKQPVQLMYTPRGHAPGQSGPDAWWCDFHDGPPLNPEALPGNTSLADLLAPQPSSPSTPPSPSSTPTLPPHSTTPSNPLPITHEAVQTPTTTGRQDLRFRGLTYIETIADDIRTLTTGRYELVKSIGPKCGSVAAGHGLSELEGLAPLESVVRAWGETRLDTLRATFSHAYHNNPRQLPNNPPPSSTNTSNTSTSTPTTQPTTSPTQLPHDPADTHVLGSPTTQRRIRFIKGNPNLGTCIALPHRFSSMIRLSPDPDHRPHLACVENLEDVKAIALKIPTGKTVIIGIPLTHALYAPTRTIFINKGCEVFYI